jgi:hypothetical protein
MTFTELTAAIWDGRSVTLIDAYGYTLRDAIPTGIRRCTVDKTKWLVQCDRHGLLGQEVRVMTFDSFDGH